MLTLDKVMTAAGISALRHERRMDRMDRAVAFLRRNFPLQLAHLGDQTLSNLVPAMMERTEAEGWNEEQVQLSALAPELYWGQGWQRHPVPIAMMHRAGTWQEPLAPRQRLSRALAGLDIWHAAISADLAEPLRMLKTAERLFSDPRAFQRQSDAAVWCAEFAPNLWKLLPGETRAEHCHLAKNDAAARSKDARDAVLFACLSLPLGLGFAANPLFPAFAQAYSEPQWDNDDERRLALGRAIVEYWRQIAPGGKR